MPVYICKQCTPGGSSAPPCTPCILCLPACVGRPDACVYVSGAPAQWEDVDMGASDFVASVLDAAGVGPVTDDRLDRLERAIARDRDNFGRALGALEDQIRDLDRAFLHLRERVLSPLQHDGATPPNDHETRIRRLEASR